MQTGDGQTPATGMWAKINRVAWPLIGLAVAAFALYLLVRELRHMSLADITSALGRVPPLHWVGAFCGAGLAYSALAWYDRLALQHLGKHLSWPFIALASFTSYALSHNIGASVLSGAVVRYRAYSTKGLTAPEIGVLVALTGFTFILGVIILGGLVLVTQPHFAERFFNVPSWLAPLVGVGMLAAVGLYVAGSLLGLKPLVIGGFSIYYPKPPIVFRQLIVGPMELIGAAAIVYFCLPAEGNPGYFIVLGIFVASFSLAVASHAPGGIGILEYLFITALRDIPPADVLAALLIFRFFYLVLPLSISLVVVLAFERQQLVARREESPPG
jgi:uncharacterized membrane protein YbhN (UPF0104 family)